ncbi:hypothetical protein PLICRDRAFT_75765, partial [Plicaturopsis crispa FD-325 SS-3]
VYHGPLTQTFRRLKIFSLSSLTLATCLTPFMFLIDSGMPMSARAVLAVTAIGTSGVSTSLISWIGKPYVTTLRRLAPEENDNVEGLEMTTLTLGLHKRITRVYDSEFLTATKRHFAKWELADSVAISKEDDSELPEPGTEETVAETMDANGNLLGRWVVKWGENGEGTCYGVGQVAR